MMRRRMDITMEALEWVGVKEGPAPTRRKQAIHRPDTERRHIGMDRARMQALLHRQAVLARPVLEERCDLLLHEEMGGRHLQRGFGDTHLRSHQLMHVASPHRGTALDTLREGCCCPISHPEHGRDQPVGDDRKEREMMTGHQTPELTRGTSFTELGYR